VIVADSQSVFIDKETGTLIHIVSIGGENHKDGRIILGKNLRAVQLIPLTSVAHHLH
jgi:archaellum biogenesis protein FlaJ (TadC family)